MYCIMCGKESEGPICPICLSYFVVRGKVTRRRLTPKHTSRSMTLPVKSLDEGINTVSAVEVKKNVLLVFAVSEEESEQKHG